VAKTSRGLEAAAISDQVGGALVAVVKGDRVDKTKAAYSDLAAGLQITKAKSIVLEAQSALVVQMGAASLVLSPASISITGAAIKLDGNTVDTGIVMDN
jgi:type VI secretion system secreted protein VgrG